MTVQMGATKMASVIQMNPKIVPRHAQMDVTSLEIASFHAQKAAQMTVLTAYAQPHQRDARKSVPMNVMNISFAQTNVPMNVLTTATTMAFVQ